MGITLKGLRPLQKLGDQAKALAYASSLYSFTLALSGKRTGRLRFVPPDPWPGDIENGRTLMQIASETATPAEWWEPEGADDERLFYLHSFGWLRDLRAVGGDRARRMARDIVANWIDHYGRWHEFSWRADVLGARLSAWISFHDFFCVSADDAFQEAFFSSCARQARHLERAVPGRLTGLPLLGALKGLALAGLCLDQDDGGARLDSSFGQIMRLLPELSFADGGIVTRSPADGMVVLKVMIDLRAALTAAGIEVPGDIQHAIDRLAPALRGLRHGDGGLCLFHGAQEGNAALCDMVLMQSGSRTRPLKSMPHAGFERLAAGRALVVMDTGVVPAPVHGRRIHAAPLAFEMSFGRDRVIVNCGTSAVPGSLREMLRATAAHSTLTVEDRNACAIGDDGVITRPLVVKAVRSDDEQGNQKVEASHNGYTARLGLIHGRTLTLDADGEVLTGEDILAGPAGADFAVRFHLHPTTQVLPIRQGEEALIRTRSGFGWRIRVSGADLSIEDSLYAGVGETPRRSSQVVLRGKTTGGNTTVRWELIREKM